MEPSCSRLRFLRCTEPIYPSWLKHLSDYRTVGLLNRQTIWVSDYSYGLIMNRLTIWVSDYSYGLIMNHQTIWVSDYSYGLIMNHETMKCQIIATVL